MVANLALSNPYAVTVETIIHLTGRGDVSFDAFYGLGSRPDQDVPEPASMMLLGFGVLGVGAWKRRRKAQQD